MKTYGLEKAQDLWCVFKEQNNKQLWLDIGRKWTYDKTKRAGIKEYEKAIKILLEEMNKNES
jgi:hypothetical protein